MKVASANQSYCFLCRLARAARWHDGRTCKCPGCGNKYVAWFGYKGSPRCGVCFINAAPLGGRESVEGECGWHKQGKCPSPAEAVLYSDGVALCWPCLTDPEKFKDNRLAILLRYKELTDAANDGTVE